LFAIHCNFKGDVVSGACLREYLHDDYEDAISECIQAGFLSHELEAKDYLHHLTNQTLQAILREHGIEISRSKGDLVEMIGQMVPNEKLDPFVGQFIKPGDLRMGCQVRRLRELLSKERDRFSFWFVELKKSWKLLPSSEDFDRAVASINSKPLYDQRWLMRRVLQFERKSLDKVAALPVWGDYWDKRCDEIVTEIVKELSWNGFYEAARQVKEYWGPIKVAQFESATSSLTPSKLGIVGQEAIWNSLLELYCEARRIELAVSGREPIVRTCHNCQREFNEASIPPKSASLAGHYLGFCRECLEIAFYRTKSGNPKIDPVDTLARLCAALGQIPTLDFVKHPRLPRDIAPERLARIIQALIDLPGAEFYTLEFGSWFKALGAAGVLGDDPVKTQRGYRSIADDGHECASLAELTIDNWMTTNKIAHEREPKYPFHSQFNANEGFRADWKAGEYYIEYFGMMEDAEYQSKAKRKIKLAAATGINLVTLMPKDILLLEKALAVLCPLAGGGKRGAD
jgi:hypothetical protein